MVVYLNMDGNYVLPFGKFKGKKLSEIPDTWFIWMYDHQKLSGQLKQYAEENIPILKIQAKQLKEKFTITIKEGRQTTKLQVSRIALTERTEQFRVVGRSVDVVLESNRPLFRNKGLKHRRPDWKLISGSVLSAERIPEAIMNHLEPKKPL